MRAVVQRVSRAAVTVESQVVGAIGRGLLVLVGVAHDDGRADARAIADKLIGLRVFADDAGAMNLSVADLGGEVLVVSQFTLYGDARRGRRPSFTAAARPQHAESLVGEVVERLSKVVPVAEGRFGASMSVELVNDGPVTLVLETSNGRLV